MLNFEVVFGFRPTNLLTKIVELQVISDARHDIRISLL